MKRIHRFTPLLLLLAAWPGTAAAQTGGTGRGVGVVTTLAGTVTVARATQPALRPLHFRDDVFVRDHIATAEKSVVRVLLGGKALVTVRELSSLTIREETGRSTVDLTSGKIAMGVVRQRMRPGEVIEIRTPNAIAAIRGTVLVVELIPVPGGAPGRPSYTTKVHVLSGLVEVSDPNDPSAPPAQVGALQSWSRTGSEPFSHTTIPPAGVDQIFVDLRSTPQIAEGPTEFMRAVTAREQSKALAVAEFLAPEMAGASAGGDGEPAGDPGALAAATPGVTGAPIVPVVVPVPPAAPPGAPAGGPTGQASLAYTGQNVAVGGSLYSLTDGQTDTPAVPILAAVNSSLSIGQSLMDLAGGSTLGSTGTAPLLHLDPSTLSAASVLTLSGGSTASLAGTLFQDHSGGVDLHSDVLRVSSGSSLIGSGTSALVDLVGSSTTAAGSLLVASSGAVVDLLRASAPLLSLTQRATFTTERSLVELSGGAAARLSQMTALTASSLTIKGHAVALSRGATMTVTGDLFRIANGSTLIITNGALLSLSGGSTLNVTGALINFVGSGSTVSITNTLCGNGGCSMVGNLPVFVAGGGTISLSNPLRNLSGNALNIAPGSAVISVTGGAQVKQGP
ncbi:MAG TPA: FecR domain-containing protein [Methylomirabilota bacterium]|nr:FecR domain-containing protein [Methylomirabilota bacterium]